MKDKITLAAQISAAKGQNFFVLALQDAPSNLSAVAIVLVAAFVQNRLLGNVNESLAKVFALFEDPDVQWSHLDPIIAQYVNDPIQPAIQSIQGAMIARSELILTDVKAQITSMGI